MAKKPLDAENDPKVAPPPPTLYAIRLKPGHPTGVYHRAGLAFSASSPTYLETVPAAVANDPWLRIENWELR